MSEDIAIIKKQTSFNFNKRSLTIDELSSYTGWVKSYIYKQTMLGRIPGASKPLGKTYFFDKEKLDEWLLGLASETGKSKIKNKVQKQEALGIAASTYITTHPPK